MNKLDNGYPDYPYRGAPTAPRFDLSKYIAAARERLWIFLVTAIVVCGAVLFAISQLEPLYKSQVTLHMLREGDKHIKFEEVSKETLNNDEDLNTQINLFRSRQILERVASRVESTIATQFLRPYQEQGEQVEHDDILAIIAENRAIIPSRLSLVVLIEFVHPDPEVAATVANYYHEAISETYSDMRSGSMDQAIRDLRAQAEIQRREVENLEQQLIDFKNTHNTISFDQGLDIDQAEMAMLNTGMAQAKETLDLTRTEWALVQSKQENGEPVYELPFISADSNIRALANTLSQLRIEIAQLSKRYRHLHPKMIQVSESLAAAQTEMDRALEVQVQMLKNQLERAENNYRKAVAKVDSKKQEILNLQKVRSVYESLQLDLSVNQKNYHTLFTRIQEIEAQNSGQTARLRVVDRAQVPSRPFQPDLKIGLLLAVAAGGVAGTLLVVVLIFFDDRIKSAVDVEDRLKLPIMGMLGMLKGRARSVPELAQLAARDPQTTETYNSIIAGLRLDPASAEAKAILITSTISNEGKSYVSASLASAFQRYGEKTLLINCDMRAGEDRLQIISGQGILPYLENEDKTLKQCIYYSQHLGCDVMPAGGHHRQPYQLFSSARFKEMLKELRGTYDRIIVDTPPAHLFGDTISLLPLCDGQIFVAGFGRARVSIASKTVAKLFATGSPMFGAIVNGIKVYQAKMYYPEHYRDVSSYKDYGKGKKRAARF